MSFSVSNVGKAVKKNVIYEICEQCTGLLHIFLAAWIPVAPYCLPQARLGTTPDIMKRVLLFSLTFSYLNFFF